MLLQAETHLNTCFKHFIYFIDQFNLVDAKELAPLAELIQQFIVRKNESSSEESPTMKKLYNGLPGAPTGPTGSSAMGPSTGGASSGIGGGIHRQMVNK